MRMRCSIVSIAPWRVWKLMLQSRSKGCTFFNKKRMGIFRNLPHIIPGRWGIFILGLEIGNRNSGNRFGMWLRSVGLWPW